MKIPLKSWWGPRAALFCAVGFGGIAAIPFISGAFSRATKGESLSLSSILEETRRKDHEDGKSKPEKLLDFKSAARLENGTFYLGGKGGLLVREGDSWSIVKNGPADEAKSLASLGNALWIAGKNGLYEMAGGSFNKVKSGDFHSVTSTQDGSLYAVSKTGVFARDPAGNWQELSVELADISPSSTTAEK